MEYAQTKDYDINLVHDSKEELLMRWIITNRKVNLAKLVPGVTTRRSPRMFDLRGANRRRIERGLNGNDSLTQSERSNRSRHGQRERKELENERKD